MLPHSGLLQKLRTIQTDRVADVNRPIPPPPPPQVSSRDRELRHAQTLEESLPSDPVGTQPKQYLAAVGLPTIPRKLATRIWELDFIEMDELLPSNRAIQALEGSRSQEAGTSSSVGLAPSQNRRTTDVMAWVRCFNLYTTVMVQRRPELIGPMAAHLHNAVLPGKNGIADWLIKNQIKSHCPDHPQCRRLGMVPV